MVMAAVAEVEEHLQEHHMVMVVEHDLWEHGMVMVAEVEQYRQEHHMVVVVKQDIW